MQVDPSDERLPLFDRFPALRDSVAWTSIGAWPTPILHADAFAAAAGIESLYIKREDLSHPDCGGNKTRGLEFLIARGREVGADCFVTFSSAGSHHISKTAWHARRFGIETVAVFVNQPNSAYVRRNIGAALACGARYIPANRLTVVPRTLWAYLSESMRRRRRRRGDRASRVDATDTSTPQRPVYFIAPGGTTRRSMLGHVNAAFELASQIEAGEMPTPDYIHVVMGSLGTAAGLALGLKLAGLSSRVVGVTVSYPWYCTPGRLARFARRVNRWMRELDPEVPLVEMRRQDFTVINDALGDGYALFTPRGEALARTMYLTHGIRMDGTYTAKALDGMMQFIDQRGLRRATHLFWHTYFEFPPCTLTPDQAPNSVRRYFETPGQPWGLDLDAPRPRDAGPRS